MTSEQREPAEEQVATASVLRLVVVLAMDDADAVAVITHVFIQRQRLLQTWRQTDCIRRGSLLIGLVICCRRLGHDHSKRSCAGRNSVGCGSADLFPRHRG